MAIVVLGRSQCGGCRRTLEAQDEVVSFSAFVANPLDPLHRFSDAAFHRACFEADALSSRALQRWREVLLRSGPGHRLCAACGGDIVDPDDYFGTGFLTDDRSSAAHEFNHLHLHRAHFNGWAKAAGFRAAIEQLMSSPSWGGPSIAFDPLPRWRNR